MAGFVVWVVDEDRSVAPLVAEELSALGFRVETVDQPELVELCRGDRLTAERVCTDLLLRLTKQNFAVVVRAAAAPPAGQADLHVSVGQSDPPADLTVDVTVFGEQAVTGQVMHELRERDLIGSATGADEVLDRLKSIGYLG